MAIVVTVDGALSGSPGGATGSGPITRADLRHKAYAEMGPDVLGFYGTGTMSLDGITDTRRFSNSAQSLNKYIGRKIYVPNGTSNDQVKAAGKLSGAKLLHTASTTYDVIGSQIYEVLQDDIEPEDLNDCARRAIRRVVFETWAPIFLFPDGDFSAADTDDWIAGATAPLTIEKSMETAYNQTGFRSLLVTNQHAGDYVVAANDVAVAPGQRYYIAALPIIVQGGPAIMRVYDKTHNREIFREGGNSALTATGLLPQHLSGVFKIPAGCYAINLRLEATASNSIVAWDSLPGHGLHWRRFASPGWLDQGWKLINVNEAQYGAEIIPGVRDALTRSYYPWSRPQDYDHEATTPESNPANLQVNRGLNGPPGTAEEGMPEADVWYHGKRAYSDISSLEDEVTGTYAPEDYLVAAYFFEVYTMLDLRRNANQWKAEKAETKALLDAQREAHRPTMGRRAPADIYIPGGSRRGPSAW